MKTTINMMFGVALFCTSGLVLAADEPAMDHIQHFDMPVHEMEDPLLRESTLFQALLKK